MYRWVPRTGIDTKSLLLEECGLAWLDSGDTHLNIHSTDKMQWVLQKRHRMLLLGCRWQWAQLQTERLGTRKKDESWSRNWVGLRWHDFGFFCRVRWKMDTPKIPGRKSCLNKNVETANDKKPHCDWLIEMKDGHCVSTVHSHGSRCWGSRSKLNRQSPCSHSSCILGAGGTENEDITYQVITYHIAIAITRWCEAPERTLKQDKGAVLF